MTLLAGTKSMRCDEASVDDLRVPERSEGVVMPWVRSDMPPDRRDETPCRACSRSWTGQCARLDGPLTLRTMLRALAAHGCRANAPASEHRRGRDLRCQCMKKRC